MGCAVRAFAVSTDQACLDTHATGEIRVHIRRALQTPAMRIEDVMLVIIGLPLKTISLSSSATGVLHLLPQSRFSAFAPQRVPVSGV